MTDLMLVYGATGTQGRPVAEGLLARGHRVRVMVRRPERAADLAARGAEVVTGDLAKAADVRQASEGADQLFLLLPMGGNPVTFAQTAIQAAQAAGVRRFVLNTSGQTPREPTGLAMMDYRIAVEDLLRQSGLPHLILRPTAYLENLLGPWALPAIVERGTLAYPTPGTHRVSWVAAGTWARWRWQRWSVPRWAGPSTWAVQQPSAGRRWPQP